MIEWYVAQTHANAELKAAGHLLRQGYKTYLPKYKKLRSHARRREWVSRPLFPRYVFVGIESDRLRWRPIRSTIGVSQLVSFGGKPVSVPASVIDGLKAREDDEGVVRIRAEQAFTKGQSVKFVTGALSEQTGFFECVDDKQRVVVLLNLLGRQTSVHVSAETVQAYA